MTSTTLLLLATGALLAGPLQAVASAEETVPYSPQTEARNYSKIEERKAEYATPAFQQFLQTESASDNGAFAQELAADPQRAPGGLCTQHEGSCAGDPRLAPDRWTAAVPKAVVTAVTFTAQDGAVLAGHVWATDDGSSRTKPGIVIVNGSVQAPETLYRFAATTLARAGYVVLTYDPQGQGRSDVQGEAPDQMEGVPAQTTGTPFYDDPTAALDFLLSTPTAHYVPRLSRGGNSHAAKSAARVAAGHDAPFDPLWRLLDPSRIGIAGHSYGASGVSYVGQADPRVKAVVAWDNLCVPSACMTGIPTGPAPAITKPELGMAADYYLTPSPYTAAPDPLSKTVGSLAATAAGVDSGEVLVRGGTHYEFSYLPDPSFPASLRGMDMVSWYTTAWFDKYVKGGDPTADARLLSNRWLADPGEAAVDPTGDGNLYSGYLRSRMDIHRSSGSVADCEDLRHSVTACAGLLQADSRPASYSYLATALGPDVVDAAPAPALPEVPLPVALPVLALAVLGTQARRRRRRSTMSLS